MEMLEKTVNYQRGSNFLGVLFCFLRLVILDRHLQLKENNLYLILPTAYIIQQYSLMVCLASLNAQRSYLFFKYPEK